jgi:coenzyme PQQ synthesis protein D (PqqD)
MAKSLSGETIVVAAKDQLSCDLGGEAAILNAKTGLYYGLDAVGARVWSLIQQPRSVRDLRETLLSEYDVEPDRCERDLLTLLDQFLAEGLIEVQGHTAA